MIRFKRGWVTEGPVTNLKWWSEKPFYDYQNMMWRYEIPRSISYNEGHCYSLPVKSPFPPDMPYGDRIMEVGE